MRSRACTREPVSSAEIGTGDTITATGGSLPRGEPVNKGLEPFLSRTELDAKKAAQEIIKHLNSKD
jgi:hypothetical protein